MGLVGQTISHRYRILRLVGRGGMAQVYKAWDSHRSVHVALKVLNEDLADDFIFLRRFAREARALEELQHPHIVRFFGFEEARGLAFLVMEFVEGVTLRRYLRLLGRPLTVPEALYIIGPVSTALHYAHTMGVCHCDVKPPNIFLEESGRVLLADFGVAHLIDSATVTFSTPGTPAYMSPEQCRGEKLDARTDVYSLGITLYEMLTLDRPFKGETAAATGSTGERVRWEQVHVPPPSPHRLGFRLPLAEAAILRALSKEPEERQRSALRLYQQLSDNGRVRPVDTLPSVGARPASTYDVEKEVVSDEKPSGEPEDAEPRRWASLPSPVRGIAISVGAVAVGGLLVLALARLTSQSVVLSPSVQSTTALTATREPTQAPALVPGRYPVGRWAASPMDDLCNGQPFGSLVFSVESADVLASGELRVNVSWTWQVTRGERSNCPSHNPMVYSDEGNSSMYITDESGRRYDHVEVGGGAAQDKLMQPNAKEQGWFIFPPPAQGASVFVFHDGDTGTTIGGIDIRR